MDCILEIIYCINVKLFECENGFLVMLEYTLILKKYILKYLGMKYYDVNLQIALKL